ncbi:hypothetical protein RA210_U10079 [Rubrivivax sp. A210]|nr:hypothetical protein RA210_U10079 [Rubrivivax sp. A210]
MNADSQLQQDVLGELGREPGLEVADIGVEVDGGVVTLRGRVGSPQQRWNAEGAALRVVGMVALVINIRVLRPPALPRADADIALAAARLLQWLARLSPDDVSVRVHSGWVTLLGELEWNYQRQAAAEAVRNVRGVAGVHNRIALRPRLSPASVRVDIEAALTRQVALSVHRLRVCIDGGDITLGGRMASAGEHEQALAAARAMPGVRRVLDHLVVPNPAGVAGLQRIAGPGRAALPHVQAANAEQADEADHDQVDGHDEIQQPGHREDEDAGQQRDQGCQREVQVHGVSRWMLGGARAWGRSKHAGRGAGLP